MGAVETQILGRPSLRTGKDRRNDLGNGRDNIHKKEKCPEGSPDARLRTQHVFLSLSLILYLRDNA